MGTKREAGLIDETDTGVTELAVEGVMGSVQPSRGQRGDIAFAWPLLKQIVELGVGTALVVRERDVIAVQATEGTVALIDRAGALCRAKGWVLLKTCDPARDPDRQGSSIDEETVSALARAGGGCLALGAGRVRLTDRQGVLQAARRARIAVVGVAE